jgi:hypothetical protein
LRAPAGFLDPRLVWLAEVDPLFDVAGIVAPPQVGLVLATQAAPELQPFVGEQREGQQAHHQPFVGFGGVLGEGEHVGRVVVPVHVADLQFDLDDGGLGRHWNPCG